MAITSQEHDLDSRLLLIEELILQRKFDIARRDLKALSDGDFAERSPSQGLYLSLTADVAFVDGHYDVSLQSGSRAVKILAGSRFDRQYGRALHVLSKTYWASGDLVRAESMARDAVATYRRAGDPLGQVSCLNELAHIAFLRSDLKTAARLLDDAVELASGHQGKVAMLAGNAGRVRILAGEWPAAERGLKKALDHYGKNGDETARANALLSLGFLHLRKREFHFAGNCFDEASEIVDRLGLKRQQVMAKKYAGELALDKGDLLKAKNLLMEAYAGATGLSPKSALVSQAGRRLAEAELAMDEVDPAMRHAQKALEVAVKVGERAEVAQAHRVIAEIFAARSSYTEALVHGRQAHDIARELGDPLDLARVELSLAEIMVAGDAEDIDRIRQLYDDATRLFQSLEVDFWVAETDYRLGVLECQQGRLSRGFHKLSRAERIFTSLAENTRVKKVAQFLTSLADQAVALSVSDGNEFKLFGRLVKRDEHERVDTSQMDGIIDVLKRRTGGDRVLIVNPHPEGSITASSFPLDSRQTRAFMEGFRRLLGEEISSDRPTLMLDCRRDPYVNDLFIDSPEVVASLIVVPFQLGDNATGYVYVDRFSSDGRLNPFSQDELNFAVGFSDLVAFRSAELQRLRLLEDNRRLKSQLMSEAAFPNIITRNHEMMKILDQVRQVVDSSISVLVEGATGSGKDLLARAIHYNSTRREKRFISVNCAALPETLLESELFGYRRGAFTGADRDKPGLFEEADGGSFFLDEIADMPLSIQAKILRVLESKELVRLGDSVPRRFDVRVISATNKSLKKELSAGTFREDLYYRLAGLTFRLPPLAERREDIPLLVEHFLRDSNKKVSPQAMQALVAYSWPGNVRELDNEIKKLTLLAGDSDLIPTEVLSDKITSKPSVARGNGSGMAMDPAVFDQDYSLYDYLASHERRFIIQALRERKGVKKHAAAMLNIPESTLRLKIKEYGIDLNRLDAVN
jgi:Nif-specific regulatory protein